MRLMKCRDVLSAIEGDRVNVVREIFRGSPRLTIRIDSVNLMDRVTIEASDPSSLQSSRWKPIAVETVALVGRTTRGVPVRPLPPRPRPGQHRLPCCIIAGIRPDPERPESAGEPCSSTLESLYHSPVNPTSATHPDESTMSIEGWACARTQCPASLGQFSRIAFRDDAMTPCSGFPREW